MRFGYTSFYDENNTLLFAVLGGVTLTGIDNTLYILDTSTWIWSRKQASGDPPKNLEGPALVHYKNRLYTAGGENTFAKISHIETLLYFGLDDNKWHNITSDKTYTSRILGGSFLKNSELYLMMGFSIEKNAHESRWYKVDLEDPNHDWIEVTIQGDTNKDLEIDSYGYTYFNETLWIFGGDENPPIINRLVIFNLSTSPIESSIYENDLSPSPRMYHSMQPIGQNLYLFGGLGDNGALYNDLWAFDVMKEKWSLTNPTGDVPPKRYGYASAVNADVMLVWGGYGQEGYLNDGYLYDISSKQWFAIEYIGTAPAPRLGACAGLSGFFIYIYGGETEVGLSDELWIYDMTSKKYNLINSGDDDGPGPVYYATCRTDTLKSNFLWVLYGEAEDDTPTNQIYGYDADQSKWIAFYDDSTNTTYSRSRAAVCKPLERVLVVGGESFALYPNNDIFYFSMEDLGFTKLGNIADTFFASASAYFQNYFYIHGGGTTATSLLRFSVPSNIFLRLPMWSFCNDNVTCNFACGYGSYRTSSNCEICPLGTYSDRFNATECKSCPVGKYGPHYGATSLDMCYPCPEGEYNNHEGQAHCLDCPHTSTCKVGSMSYNYTIDTYEDSYSQPAIYSSNNDDADQNSLIIEIVVGAVGALALISFFLSRKSRMFLIRFDLYPAKHNHSIGVPMMLKRTKIGGIFGIIFLFLAIIIIGVEVTNFALKNIYETKSLVPLVVLEQDIEKFEALFLIKITLMNYGSKCDEGYCANNNIYTEISGISGNWTAPKCEHIEYSGDCVISTTCIECSISKQGTLTVTMDDTNGYTSGYSVNVTASSSIPNKFSSYKTYVLPDSNHIFIGSDPTVIYFDIIPSYYEDTEETGNHTGYHISLDKVPHKGAQFKPYELGLAYINYLKIVFDVDNNGLTTTRYYNQTWIVLLTTLLGSVFGVMESVGSAMKFVEKNAYAYNKRRKHRSLLGQLEKNSKTIAKLREDPCFKPQKEPDSSNTVQTVNDALEKSKLKPDVLG
ncbi:unnamed protein product [Blepharisma stoltei]|uniref:Tyrosine-protein kinase ephrin type A/B receptor-like domain-containing protein n=1 Tax=Blepharisma stoltei TaxID=1481888 RepID=A0AAU9J4R3_9CILI|nr:unnamed protein product [Blepharisma stoltei]